jgi:hypothetical protein
LNIDGQLQSCKGHQESQSLFQEVACAKYLVAGSAKSEY